MFFPWLASLLSLGGLVSLLLVHPGDFGNRFHRFIGILAAVFLTAGLSGGALRGITGWMALSSCVVWVILVQWGPHSWIRRSLVVPVLLTGGAILLGTPYPPRAPLLELKAWTAPGNTLAAALLLGAVSLAMLLGHWYLVLPGLDIRHLKKMVEFLGICVGARLGFGVLSLSIARPLPSLGVASAWWVAGRMAAFFFWQRVAIGLVAPAILVVLVSRTVRISSTQSATGLLYVTMIFVLVGELISRYLYLTLGIPQ